MIMAAAEKRVRKKWTDPSVQQRVHQIREHQLIEHEALNRVRQLTSEERLRFLEYAALTSPVVTRTWLDRFARQIRQ